MAGCEAEDEDADMRELKALLSSVLQPLAAVPSVHELEMLAAAASKGCAGPFSRMQCPRPGLTAARRMVQVAEGPRI